MFRVRLSKWVVGIVICGLGLVIWPIRFGAVGEGLDPGLKPWETHLEPPEAATISASSPLNRTVSVDIHIFWNLPGVEAICSGAGKGPGPTLLLKGEVLDGIGQNRYINKINSRLSPRNMLSMGIRAPAPATYDRSALFPKHEHGTWSESTHQMQIISIREMMGLSIDAVEMEIDDRPVIVLSFLDIGMPFSMMSPDMPGNTASGRLLGRFSYDAVHVTLPADRGAIYGIRLKNQKISLPPPKPKERFVPENAPLIEATAARTEDTLVVVEIQPLGT